MYESPVYSQPNITIVTHAPWAVCALSSHSTPYSEISDYHAFLPPAYLNSYPHPHPPNPTHTHSPPTQALPQSLFKSTLNWSRENEVIAWHRASNWRNGESWNSALECHKLPSLTITKNVYTLTYIIELPLRKKKNNSLALVSSCQLQESKWSPLLMFPVASSLPALFLACDSCRRLWCRRFRFVPGLQRIRHFTTLYGNKLATKPLLFFYRQ